jgi:glycerol-3-phosphate dehydrogenase
MELSTKKSQEQADLFRPIIHMIDAVVEHLDTDYLDTCAQEMAKNLSHSESMSFIIGGNNLAEFRRRCEIEMLNKIIDLFKTRKRHFEKLKEEEKQENFRQQNINKIKNLL